MKLTLAALLALAATMASAGPASDYVIMKDDRVETYYGVPTSLKISDVRTLSFPYKDSFEMSEGQKLRTAIVSARNNVKIVVVFDHRGDAVSLRTTSRRAVDPRGVRVGDKLSYVQKVWPAGKRYYGGSIEGGHPYATFTSGTNVVLNLSTNIKDVKRAPSKVHVEEIEIVGFKIL